MIKANMIFNPSLLFLKKINRVTVIIYKLIDLINIVWLKCLGKI